MILKSNKFSLSTLDLIKVIPFFFKIFVFLFCRKVSN